MTEGSQMRASDADRDRAIETLAAANAEGRLGLEEYSQRSEAALTALTLADLGRLTADLPAPSPGDAVAVPEKITAVLGNETRKGPWVVPPYLEIRSVLGDCHLELQQAVIRQQVTTIHASVRFGSVTIFVPDGVDVRLTGRAVLSSKSSDLRGEPKPGPRSSSSAATCSAERSTSAAPPWTCAAPSRPCSGESMVRSQAGGTTMCLTSAM